MRLLQSGSNVENVLNDKQLTEQPTTLKTLMQKILVGLRVKILSSLKLSFSATVFGTT